MMRRRSLKLGLVAVAMSLFAGATTSFAQAPEYEVIDPPQMGSSPDKIEVLEFFSYMCPHCYHFEPLVSKWQQSLPPNVVFKKIPVTFNAKWEAPTRMYLTLEAMGLTPRMNMAVFDAIHKNNVNFSEEKTRIEWVKTQGIDARKFSDTWKSFSVDSQVKRSMQLAQSYKINGVPTLTIGGRYLVNSSRGFESMLRTADAMLAKVRAERPTK